MRYEQNLNQHEVAKKNGRVTIAVPDHIESWLNDHARVLGITRSELCCNWIIEKLEDQSRVRKSGRSAPEIINQLLVFKSAIDTAFRQIRPLKAGARQKQGAAAA